MRTKQVRLRNAFGVSHVEDLVDFDGVVEIAKAILVDEPNNERCRMFLKWVEIIGEPTHEQFQEFLSAMGVRLNEMDAEEIQN